MAYQTFETLEAELVEEGYTHGYISAWGASDIDRGICAASTCEHCGHRGMEYHAFSRPEEGRRSSYRAVAACHQCQYAVEF